MADQKMAFGRKVMEQVEEHLGFYDKGIVSRNHIDGMKIKSGGDLKTKDQDMADADDPASAD